MQDLGTERCGQLCQFGEVSYPCEQAKGHEKVEGEYGCNWHRVYSLGFAWPVRALELV